MAMYSAGKVGVDIVPDTDGFWTSLDAQLHSRNKKLEIPVELNPDTASYQRVRRSIDGDTLTNVVKIEGDASGLRKIDREYEQARKQWEKRPVTFRYDLDDNGFSKVLSDMSRKAEQVSALFKQSDRGAAESLRSTIDGLSKSASEYRKKYEELSARRTKLRADEQAQYELFGKELDKQALKSQHYLEHIDAINKVIKQYRTLRDEAKANKDIESYDWYKTQGLPAALKTLRDTKKAYSDLQKEIRKTKKAQDSLFGSSFQKQDADLAAQAEAAADGWAEAAQGVERYSSAASLRQAHIADFLKSNDQVTESLGRTIRAEQQHDILTRRAAQDTAVLSEGQQALAQALGDSVNSHSRLKARISDTSRVMEKQKAMSKELTGLFDEQENEISKLSKAFRDFKPMGIDKRTAKSLNDLTDGIRKMRVEAERRPLTVKMKLDNGEWERQYARILKQAKDLHERLNREHQIDVRVKVWDDQADNLEKRLRKLRSERVDIPVDWQVDQQRIISRMREIAEEIKRNPDRQVELEANLDLDMKHAEEKLQRFREKNDEFKMDVDLETALARAHLAYFTRPRTVDIFANFKGTDLGKIFTGMTSGATGLKGVENQFRSLVNMFDKLDKVVPKWSLLGAGVTALGAGLLNLGRTAGGVGVSLVSMSKAALAAPAALTGLAAAGLNVYWIYKDLKTNFDITKTALSNLDIDAKASAWKEYGDQLYKLADDIAPTLTKGLTGIATEEGKVLNGLIGVVRQSDEAQWLPRIFDNTRKAVSNLNPGLQDLVKAFFQLGDQSSQYLPRMTSYISDMAGKWANWVETASRTGQISKAMEQAIEQGGYLKSSLSDLIGVVKGLFGPLAESQNGLEVFATNVAKADRAVNSARFQETLSAWVEGAKNAQDGMRNAFDDIADSAYSLKDVATQVIGDAGTIVGNAISGISRALQQMGPGLGDFSSGIRDGFGEVFDAIGNAGPMFSDLASMVGQLSRTFGGTFAASLKAAAPLIQAIAKGAETVATAFSKLPQPVQSAIGLYMTFGRAGKTAWDTLKTSMLDNTIKTASYAKQLNSMGVTMSGMKPSMLDIAAGWGLMQTSAEKAASGIESAGKAAATASTPMGKLKAAGSGLLSALAGINPATLAVGTALGIAGVEWADYSEKAAATAAANEQVNSSLDNLKYTVNDTGKAVSNLSESMKAIFATNESYGETGWDWFTQNFGPNATGQYKTTADAAKQLGVDMGTLEKMTKASDSTYQKWLNGLAKGTKYGDDNSKALNKVRASLDEMRESEREHIKTTAEANGHSAKYVDSLMKLGNATEFMSLKAKSAAEQQSDYVSASKLMQDSIENERNARIKAARSASDYGSVLDSMGDSIKHVQELAADGDQIWDGVSKSFDFTTDAGRAASDAISNLAASANDYLDAMIDSGASYDKVESQQKKMSSSLADTANQLTNNADGAANYANSLLKTPEQIKTDIRLRAEQAKSDLLAYTSMLEKVFPETTNGQAVYDTIIRLEANGAITSFDQVNAKKKEMLDGLKDGTLAITVDADGQQAVTSMETVKRLGGELQQDGTYKVSVSADDLATPDIENLIKTLADSGLDGKQISMFLNAKGNAKLDVDDVRNSLEKLGMSDKDIEIIMNSKGDAPEQMKVVEQKLKDLGASPKMIEWFLKALDQTLEGTESAQKSIDGVQQKSPAPIKSQDATQEGVSKAQSNIDSVKQPVPAPIDATDNTGWPTTSAKNNIFSVPSIWNSNVNAFTHGLGEVQTLAGTIASLQDKTVTVTSVLRTFIQKEVMNDKGWDGVYNFGGNNANGGRITGPGTGTSDSIPAWLSNGEMVIKASSVRKLDAKYGRGFLNALNAYGDVSKASSPSASALASRQRSQAYASGGRVRASIDRWTVNLNPVIKVEIPENRVKGDTTINQTINNKIVRADQDLYPAAAIQIRAAARELRLR